MEGFNIGFIIDYNLFIFGGFMIVLSALIGATILTSYNIITYILGRSI